MQASSTQNGRDSESKRLGVKKFGGEEVFPDDILIRQRGFKWHAGKNTYVGKDHTVHSKIEGQVRFEKKYTDSNRKVTTIHVDPIQVRNQYNRPPPPFCYHPELFPEKAINNPQPTNHFIRNPNPIKVKRADFRGSKVQNVTHTRKIAQIPQEYLEQQNHWNIKATQGELIIKSMQQLESKFLGIQYQPIPEEAEEEIEATQAQSK